MDSNCAQCATKLEELLIHLPSNGSNEEMWQDIEQTARTLANGLRVRDGADNHTTLGKSALPQVLTSLLTTALNGSPIPDVDRVTPVYEILRVGANLCVEHDPNRGQLLDAGFPQAIVSLLEGFADTIPSGIVTEPLPLSIANLQVVKTAIGVLLNASLGYEPVKFRLTSLEVAMTLVRLSSAIYPTASWMRDSILTSGEGVAQEITESWNLRSGLTNWAWRLIAELKDDSRPLFDPDVLPHLIPTLVAFTPPTLTSPPPPFFAQPSPLRTTLLQADFDLLAESCSQIESLALDVEDVRLSLARGFQFPAEHNGVPCLSSMLDFIETGNYAPLWYVQDDNNLENGLSEVRSKEKAFDDCKAAVIKAVVEVSGEDKNVDVLCDDSDEERPGGDFVSRLVGWIRSFVGEGNHSNARDDLVICATLSLGNLTRREFHSTILLSSPHNIAQLLSTHVLLSPSTDIKLKHGVIGLLKHLAQSSSQSPANRAALSNSSIIERITTSGIWDDRSDVMADIVQVNAIGVVKHLCSGSVDNSLVFVLGTNSESAPTGFAQLISLIRRSDTIAIKSEGTRVLVNVIRSLWSSEPAGEQRSVEDTQKRQQKREQAIKTLLIPACAEALAALIGRSFKYSILINEGVVALSLLSIHNVGGPLVLNALLSALPVEATPPSAADPVAMSTTASVSSEVNSPIVASPVGTRGRSQLPRRAIDQLILVLRNTPGNDDSGNSRPTSVVYPVEIKANVCALLGQVTKTASGGEIETLKEITRPTLEELTRTSQGQGRDGMLGVAAKRVLDMWTSA